MKNIIYCLLLLIIISCGKESPVVVDPVISFTLTVTSGVGGSVSSPGGSYTEGKSTSITATPDSEYVFVNWSNGSTDNPLSVTVNSNQTITANFEKRKYPLTLSITGSGTVSEEIISAGKSTTEYTSGSTIQLTATPSQDWSFVGWSGSVSSSENPIELTVNESKNVTATFEISSLQLFSNKSIQIDQMLVLIRVFWVLVIILITKKLISSLLTKKDGWVLLFKKLITGVFMEQDLYHLDLFTQP